MSIRRRLADLERLATEQAPPGRDADAIREQVAALMADPDALELAGQLGELAIDLDTGDALAQLAEDPRVAGLLDRLAEAMDTAVDTPAPSPTTPATAPQTPTEDIR